MSFGQPLWFWAFALFPVLLIFFIRNERRREKLLRLLVAARLQERLAGSVSVPFRRLRFALLLLALACLIVSLTQPRLGYTWEQSKRKGRDVIIAIDCSRSMLATDLAPNRIMRAKLAVQDLIGQLQGDRVGLIAFAGSAFLQAPLTIDYGAVLNALAELDTDIIPRGGTNIAAAITEADSAFGKGESDHRCLIILTDGEELDANGVTAASAQKDRIKIFTVGLGSADGSLIPIPGQGGGTAFVKDSEGNIVKSKLDEDRLRKIAEATGGFYVHLQNGPAEMQQIVRDGLGQMKEQEIDARMSRRPIERYQWPLAAGLVLLVASTLVGERKRAVRRRTMAVAAVLVFGLLPPAAEAKNRGVEAYEREDYPGAMKEFSRQLERQKNSEALHFDLGAAAYKAGDFGKALEAFARAVTSPDPQLRAAAEYNLGNTLFQRGAVLPDKERKVREWKDALQHYEQALKVAPQNKDAEYNRDVVRKLLEELEKEPPKDEQQQQQDQQQPPPQNKDDQNKDKQDQQKNQQQQPQDGQKEKDQQQQQSQQKDQPQNQQSKESQGEQSKDQQQGKDQPSEDKEGKKDPAQQQKDGKGEQKKDAKDDPSQTGQDSKGQAGEKQEQPAPSPEQPDQLRGGAIQAQGEQPKGDPQEEAAAEAQAAQEGRMTEAQAKNLLESLKGEDERVQLLKPGERRPGRAFRDW